MQEQFFQLLSILGVVWRRRWQAMLIATAVCLIGWTIVLFMPNKYTSTTRVFLNRETMLTPLLKGLAVDSNVTQATASMMRRSLLSRPNLEKVIAKTDLSLLVENEQQKERLMLNLAEKITITVGGDHSEIYSLSYEDIDAKRAASVVKMLLDIFIEEALGASQLDTNITEKFLDQQIMEYEAKLIKAEEELKDFKQKHIAIMPTQGRTYFERLQENKELLQKAELELSEAKNSQNELKRQIETIKTTMLTSNDKNKIVDSKLGERIKALEDKLNDLLLNYTSDHPDVLTTKRVLDELYVERDSQIEQIKAGDSSIMFEKNTAYVELVAAYSKAQATVAGLQVRKNEYEKRVKELNNLIDTIPKVEAELAKLNRDYEINKQNYEGLVSRKASAKISEQADKNTDQLQFKIIEPPKVPLIPTSPNRIKLSTVVLFIALVLGAGYAWLIGQIKPTFDSVRRLQEAYGIPVLGGISVLLTEDETKRQRYELFKFMAFIVIVLVTYLSLMMFYTVTQ